MIPSHGYLFKFVLVAGVVHLATSLTAQDLTAMEKVDFGPDADQGHGPSHLTAPAGPPDPDLLQYDDQDEDDGKNDKEDHDDLNKKKGSLAFVFDTTASMRSELKELIEGAKLIVKSLRNRPNSPIRNYIWVPFNDPVIGPVTVTKDSTAFIERMQNITIQGGGDCAEMVLGGLKRALDECLPNSYIYVFTDAPSKHPILYKEIVRMVQYKRAKVFFILTKGCLDNNMSKFALYDHIAQRSSGQIFKVDSGEFQQILKYIDSVLVPNLVVTLAANKNATEPGKWDEKTIEIDESVKRFTVALAGIQLQIQLFDPQGNLVNETNSKTMLDLANVKVITIEHAYPGQWKVKVQSTSVYNLRAYAISTINFNYGFSKAVATSFDQTNSVPLKGEVSNILIKVNDPQSNYNYDTLEVMDLSDEKIQTLKLTPVEDKDDYYMASGFNPPSQFFMLKLIAGASDVPFKVVRVTPTGITGGTEHPPVMRLASQAMRQLHKATVIRGHVQSLVPVTITCMKDGKPYGMEQNCSESCYALIKFPKILPDSEGNYTCTAKNSAGTATKVMHLTVGYPPIIRVQSPYFATAGDNVVLNCHVISQDPVVVTWYESPDGQPDNLHPLSPGVAIVNTSLSLSDITEQSEGYYVCMAKSKGGKSWGVIEFLVGDEDEVRVVPSFASFTEKQTVSFTCGPAGRKPFDVEWQLSEEQSKNPCISVRDQNGTSVLTFANARRSSQGCYMCRPKNAKPDSSYAIAHMVYTRGVREDSVIDDADLPAVCPSPIKA